ncbi:MAG TPA: phosphotransferase, partial [Candidatus Eremiobacteraceae bacterium]|nr:phosphotransferase [Candidatus Eremiobacteraceae bacterium]
MLLEEWVGQPTTEAEAERLALELYGLHGAAKALPGEYDDNFHLTVKAPPVGADTPAAIPLHSSSSTLSAELGGRELKFTSADGDGDGASSAAADVPQPESEKSRLPPAGTDFVLKVMHPARESALIDLQCQALQHLAHRAPQVGVPRVCLNKNGEAFTTITGSDGSPRIAWLLTYIPGTLMAHVNPHSAEMLRSLGELLGELSSGLAHFSHGAARRELKWDFARAGWI